MRARGNKPSSKGGSMTTSNIQATDSDMMAVGSWDGSRDSILSYKYARCKEDLRWLEQPLRSFIPNQILKYSPARQEMTTTPVMEVDLTRRVQTLVLGTDCVQLAESFFSPFLTLTLVPHWQR